MIYLDNAATTEVSTLVLEEMMPYLTGEYGNPGALYQMGRKAHLAVKCARERVADFIGASPEQIIFTSGGSEANNIVIRRTRNYLEAVDKNVVLTSSVEHDSVLNSLYGLPSLKIKVDSLGVVHADDVEKTLNEHPDIGLVSIMYVNNETGSMNPVDRIGKICAEHGVLFHTDCVQAAGCQPINVKKIGCDFLSLSSHKIHGIKGVGALFVKNKELLTPQIYGGAHQEFGLRSGTENVAGIVGFGKACERAGYGQGRFLETVSLYKREFYDCLLDELHKHNLEKIVHINGESITSKGKTLNLRFDGVDAETLLLMLDSKGVCISAGSACRSHESQPSHVLTAMGLTDEQARDSVRISFSDFNNKSDITTAAYIMSECIRSLSSELSNK